MRLLTGCYSFFGLEWKTKQKIVQTKMEIVETSNTNKQPEQ
jgi:hypothetical protein